MEGWERVAERVTATRVRRGYRSQGEFAAAAGLSTSTMDSIEHARKKSYDPATIGSVEHVLGWKPGSVKRILAGLEPQVDPEREDGDLSALLDAWPHLSPAARRILRLLATEGLLAE